MNDTSTRTATVADLRDGDVFSIDDGATWHTFVIHGFGTVSVGTGALGERTSRCYRIDADMDWPCAIRDQPAD